MNCNRSTNRLFKSNPRYVFLISLLVAFIIKLSASAVPFTGWGSDPWNWGVTTAPPSATNIIALSCGWVHNVVIRSNRTVLAWGYGGNGVTNVPVGLSNVVAISAGGEHTLALRENGTVVAWGSGKTMTGNSPEYGQSIVPTNLNNVAAVAAGLHHSLALKADGTVVGWGRSYEGQTTAPAGYSNVVAIAAGQYHSLTLHSDGSVQAWGDTQTWENDSAAKSQVPPDLRNIFAIAAAPEFSLALRADGTVIAWGRPDYDRTNVPPDLTNVVEIATGPDHPLALRADGTVVSWGGSGWSQTNTPAGLSNVVAVGGGRFHSLAMTNHSAPYANAPFGIRTVTAGSTAQLWIPHGGQKPLFYQWKLHGTNLPLATNAALVLPTVQVSQTGNYSLAITNGLGGTISSNFTLSVVPLAITLQPKSQTTFPGTDLELTVRAVGVEPISYQWQFGGTNLVGATNSLLVRSNIHTGQTGVYTVVVSNAFGTVVSSEAVISMSQVVAWGNDQFGQASVPPGLSNVVAITAGANHSLALNRDGTVVAWGSNAYGESEVPPNVTNIVAIAAGDGFSTVLKGDGSVFSWGRVVPWNNEMPEGLTNVIAIAAGGDQTVALQADGTFQAWGFVWYDQRTPPSNVVAIAAGDYYSEGVNIVALTAEGTVFAPSSNLGETNIPSAISIAAGYSHVAVLHADGNVLTFGYSAFPEIHPDLADAVAIDAGDQYTMAVKKDGTVKCVDHNDNNGEAPIHIPSGLKNVSAIACGDRHAVALLGDGPPFVTSAFGQRTVIYGATNLLYVQASGGGPLQYQWRHNGTNIPFATNALLTLHNVGYDQAGWYSVVVSNPFGSVTNSNLLLHVTPLTITQQPISQSIYIGGTAEFAVAVNSAVPLSYQWQFNGNDIPGATAGSLNLTNVQLAYSGEYAVVVSNPAGAVRSSDASLSVGRVVWWGEPYTPPDLPPGLTNVIALAHGYGFALALKDDGTIIGWGANYDGQVSGAAYQNGCVAVAAGASHGVALRTNGTVVAWGYNNHGQIQVPAGLSNVIAVAAGSYSSMALKADGTIVAWGTAATLTGSTNIVAIAGGDSGSRGIGFGLKSNGTIIAWGQTNVVTHPPASSGFVTVAGRTRGGLALRADGSVLSWGNNDYGQTNMPAGLSNVVAIAGGNHHNLALKADGTVVMWGNNDKGQTVPPIPLTNVAAVAGGGYRSVALLGNGPPALTAPLAIPTKTTNFTVRVPTKNGHVYRLEHTDSLSNANWNAAPLVGGTGSERIFSGPVSTNSQRFYRVRQWRMLP